MKKDYPNDPFLQKRKERQRQMRKRRSRILLVFFIAILLIVGTILSFTVFFPIKNINASGSGHYTQSEIVKVSQIEVGDNLFAISKKDTLETLKTKLPFIESIEFKRTLPDTLTIKVKEAKEFTCYKFGNKYYTVSESGWVLKAYDEKPENVIEVVASKFKCKVGTALEFSDESSNDLAENVINNLVASGLSLQEVDISNRYSLKAKVENRFTVEFGSTADLEHKIKHLKTMIESIPENKKGKIDLSVWNSQNTQGIFVENSTK